ncbi:[NiFe]-hydrogenase assembly chaperone HybE [Halochromatium glycolicum]|nr:[NiFe]-hydrogenase assembly chaperone HybE [Halochromatium glycolicum]
MAIPSADPGAMASPECQLAAVFEQIHQQRMLGLPILNPALRVAVIGGRRWQDDWVGVLITPWCMNLVLLPGSGSARRPGAVGSTLCIRLPAGTFELIASYEPDIGSFAACSLFSPMQGFADQPSAVAVAETVIAGLFEPQPAGARPASENRPGISRRDLLRGKLRG